MRRARAEVIEAGAKLQATASAPVTNLRRARARRASGPTLSKSEWSSMRSRHAERRRAVVEHARSSNQRRRRPKNQAAGGGNSLVGAVASAYVAPGRPRTPPPSSGRPSPASAKAPDYDDLTDQATYAYDAKDAARATQLLSRAIQLDGAQPRAYQLLGFTQLYLQGNITEAEKNMRMAIELGGSASFRVFHDHANGSFNSTCAGTLFVTKKDVTFKADDGKDTFEADAPSSKDQLTTRVGTSACCSWQRPRRVPHKSGAEGSRLQLAHYEKQTV